MLKIIYPGWQKELHNFVNGVEDDLLVVTPFFTNKILNDIISIHKRQVHIRFLFGEISNYSVVDGSTDPKVLENILSQRKRISCRCIKNLHAKILVRDSSGETPSAILTSSNLTGNGVNKNIEFGVLLKGDLVKELVDQLEYYWENAEPFNKNDLKTLLHDTDRTSRTRQNHKISFGKVVSLFKHLEVDETIREYIESYMKNNKKYYRERAKNFKKASELLLGVKQNELTLRDFNDILYIVQDQTGAFCQPNTNNLLNNNIRNIRESLKLLLDDEVPLEQRINRLLDDKKLKGGALGFISSMLFLANSKKYNIYNKTVVKGLQKIIPQVQEAYNGLNYIDFNNHVNIVKNCLEIRSEQIDNILWKISEI